MPFLPPNQQRQSTEGNIRILTYLLMYCLLYTEAGCGNAVLRIYSNMSTLPTYELCGITKDKQIVTAGNAVRFKYILNQRFSVAFLPRDATLPARYMSGLSLWCHIKMAEWT